MNCKCLDVIRNEFFVVVPVFVALLPLRRFSELDTLWTQTSVDQSRVHSDHSLEYCAVEPISVFEANAETVVSYVLSLNWKGSTSCSEQWYPCSACNQMRRFRTCFSVGGLTNDTSIQTPVALSTVPSSGFMASFASDQRSKCTNA